MSRPVVLPAPLAGPVVDNHCHLDMARGDGPAPSHDDISAVLRQAGTLGVTRVVHSGCDLPGAQATVGLVERFPEVLGAVALHPNEAARLGAEGTLENAWEQIANLAQHPRIRSVGETGLDYFRTGPEGQSFQEQSFRWHIRLAAQLGKPLQVHDRDAHEDVLRILADEAGASRIPVVLHCFSGDKEMALECVQRGYYLSISGVVTFKNAQSLRDAVAVVPLEQLLVETDAPYLTPHPYRGANNNSALLPFTVRAVAEVLEREEAQVCAAVSANAEKLYGEWR